MTPEEKRNQNHSLLIDVCQELGSIATSNSRFTVGLTDRISAAGKNIEELTVRELLSFNHQHNEFFNDLYARFEVLK